MFISLLSISKSNKKKYKSNKKGNKKVKVTILMTSETWLLKKWETACYLTKAKKMCTMNLRSSSKQLSQKNKFPQSQMKKSKKKLSLRSQSRQPMAKLQLSFKKLNTKKRRFLCLRQNKKLKKKLRKRVKVMILMTSETWLLKKWEIA